MAHTAKPKTEGNAKVGVGTEHRTTVAFFRKRESGPIFLPRGGETEAWGGWGVPETTQEAGTTQRGNLDP